MSRRLLMTTALLGGICCEKGTAPLPYLPEVTFAGFFNGEYDSLTGNRQWPNTCALAGDTVRIFCYSASFHESQRIRCGDLMRIDLLPDSGDGFELRNVLFHLARYYQTNESYTISPGDTSNSSVHFRSETVSFSRAAGAQLELRDIFAATPPVSLGRYLEIRDGHLLGMVRPQ